MTRTYNHARAGTTSTREDHWWQESAACRGMSIHLFFGEDNEQTRAERERRAKAVCRSGCPVIQNCLQHAIDWNEQGVWGGTTAKERARIKRGTKGKVSA
jgi:WhiB family redox-sensing transcriptional regulator